MGENKVLDKRLSEEEKRKLIVEKERVVEVKRDCRVDFTAVP
jgi:hypothetical protein